MFASPHLQKCRSFKINAATSWVSHRAPDRRQLNRELPSTQSCWSHLLAFAWQSSHPWPRSLDRGVKTAASRTPTRPAAWCPPLSSSSIPGRFPLRRDERTRCRDARTEWSGRRLSGVSRSTGTACLHSRRKASSFQRARSLENGCPTRLSSPCPRETASPCEPKRLLRCICRICETTLYRPWFERCIAWPCRVARSSLEHHTVRSFSGLRRSVGLVFLSLPCPREISKEPARTCQACSISYCFDFYTSFVSSVNDVDIETEGPVTRISRKSMGGAAKWALFAAQ